MRASIPPLNTSSLQTCGRNPSRGAPARSFPSARPMRYRRMRPSQAREERDENGPFGGEKQPSSPLTTSYEQKPSRIGYLLPLLPAHLVIPPGVVVLEFNQILSLEVFQQVREAPVAVVSFVEARMYAPNGLLER